MIDKMNHHVNENAHRQKTGQDEILSPVLDDSASSDYDNLIIDSHYNYHLKYKN